MRTNTATPWEDNEPFIQFVKAFQEKQFTYMFFHSLSRDEFLLSLKEKYVDDRRHLQALILCLKSRLLEAKLRTLYEDKQKAIWEVWFHIQDIARLEGKCLHEEFMPLLKEISDATIPYMWAEFQRVNQKSNIE